jgi:hypothetical protein
MLKLCIRSRTVLHRHERFFSSKLFNRKDVNGGSLNGAALPMPSLNNDDASNPITFIPAETLKVAVDLEILRPGDTLDIPYELTITDSFADLWHSAFLSQDRLQTSTPFCRKLGFQDRLLPFGLLAFLTSSMTHADAAKIQVGYGPIQYFWPGFTGDTFTKRFKVQSVRNTSDGLHSIIQFQCNLYNQRNKLCMRADKRMMFETRLVESSPSVVPEVKEEEELLRNHILSKSGILHKESHSLCRLRPGQLIRHDHARSLTQAQSQQLASLARLTHHRHFHAGKNEKLLLPGGLIVGLCQSASARELHEILHEEVLAVQFCHEVSPDTTVVGALSYISNIQATSGDLELVTVRTIGIDVSNNRELPKALPQALLEGEQLWLPKELEIYCAAACPSLCGRIVLQMDRKILRQSTSKPKDVFLL